MNRKQARKEALELAVDFKLRIFETQSATGNNAILDHPDMYRLARQFDEYIRTGKVPL